MQSIGILIEVKDGLPKRINYGVITTARTDGYELVAFLLDGLTEEAKKGLQEYGINRIVEITSDQGPIQWHPDLWADAICQAMRHYNTDILFGLASIQGKELLSRVAAQLDAPLILDCIAVNLENQTARKFQYSGKTIATMKIKGRIHIYGIRPNAIEPVPAPCKTDTGSFRATIPETILKLTDVESVASNEIDLTEADVILSGGRGMQNGENFHILHECAKIMHAGVGASRVAVDSGWVPHAMQVGQTGKTVSPKVYIACGISGSVQHFAGMKTSAIIIAINLDPNAAITKLCDYFAIADLFELVPALTNKLKQSTNKIA